MCVVAVIRIIMPIIYIDKFGRKNDGCGREGKSSKHGIVAV